MDTIIISAFPGTGKTYYHQKNPDTTLDSDSSDFSWVKIDGEKKRNPNFPQNYIKHIKDNKYEYIFVSSHETVRDSLQKEGIKFALIYPKKEDQQIYIERYKQRGSPQSFINCVKKNWDTWIKECNDCEWLNNMVDGNCLNGEETVSDVMRFIRARRNGDKKTQG